MLKYALRIKSKNQSRLHIDHLGDPMLLLKMFVSRRKFTNRQMRLERRKENGGKMSKRQVDHVLGWTMFYNFMEACQNRSEASQNLELV